MSGKSEAESKAAKTERVAVRDADWGKLGSLAFADFGVLAMSSVSLVLAAMCDVAMPSCSAAALSAGKKKTSIACLPACLACLPCLPACLPACCLPACLTGVGGWDGRERGHVAVSLQRLILPSPLLLRTVQW